MFLHKKMTVNHKISGELLSDKPKNVPRCTKSSTNRMWYDISWHLACLYKTSIISNMIQATSPAHLGSPNGSTSWHLLAAGQPSNTWLVVGFYPSKNHGVKVSWDDDIPFPIWWESHKSHVPNHQPDGILSVYSGIWYDILECWLNNNGMDAHPESKPGWLRNGGMHPRWKPAGNWSDAASEFRYQTPFAGRKKASSSDSAKM